MKTKFFPLFVILTILLVLSSACATQNGPLKAELPVDKAYAEGKEIYFTHTEASNEAVAQKLTQMMSSPVPYVPSLTKVPDEALANVYSFTNGIKGAGGSGYQMSVFDNPPGAAGYSPLRRLNSVTWVDESKARELKSAAEILTAADAGEVVIKQPGIVINMPIIVWDGGKR